MKKEIVVNIEGDIGLLLTRWSPPKNVQLEKSHDESIDLVLKDHNLDEFTKLEAIVNELKSSCSIEIVGFFKAYDFTKEELMASNLLCLQVLSLPYLDIEGKSPIHDYRCENCHRIQYNRTEIDTIHLTSHEIINSLIVASGTINLFHKNLLKQIRDNLMDRFLKIVPCSIRIERYNRTINDYYWIYSDIDLNLPTGGIKYGKKCPTCGFPEIIQNHSFITTYNRENWNNEDFCTSSFFGADTLFVSQRVYRLIDRLPKVVKGDVIFEPIMLL